MEVDPEADKTIELETESGTLYFCSESCRDAYAANRAEAGLQERLLTTKGWTAAFRNAIGEWSMLWKDIVAGFLIAGFIAGILIHYICNGLGLIPPMGQPGGVAPSGYTLYLNIFFTLLFAVQLVVRFGKPADRKS